MYCPVAIMSPDLSFEIKGKQRSPRYSLSKVRVYHERVYLDIVVSNFWSARCFSFQKYSKLITNITSENVSQIRTKECKTRYFICKINCNFCILRDTLTVIQFSLKFCLVLNDFVLILCSWPQQYQ